MITCCNCHDEIEDKDENFVYIRLGSGRLGEFMCGTCREMRTDWQYSPYQIETIN